MTIEKKEQQIVNEFSIFDDWMDRYNYLIELGKSMPIIDDKYKTDQYLISGCQSKVWLYADFEDGKVLYSADSDAIITKGIVNLLIRILSNQTPQEIIDAPLGCIDSIGLKEHLSPTRSNGLVSMIKQMKMYAMVYKLKQQ